MCNTWSHSAGCNYGWGAAGLCCGFSATSVRSYMNPNAYCPECGERVFFYRSPYNDRVFSTPLPQYGTSIAARSAPHEPQKMLKAGQRGQPHLPRAKQVILEIPATNLYARA